MCLQKFLLPWSKLFVFMKKVLIVIFLIFSLSLSGTTYYVSTNGSDAANGLTVGTAWLTWQKGFNALVVGDKLYIRGGIYYPGGVLNGESFNGVRVSNRNGVAGKLITVSAYPGETPILDCINITQSGYHSGLILEDCNNWDIKGLTIRNVIEYQNGGSYNYPVNGWAIVNCSNITIEQCNIYGSAHGFTGGQSDYIYYINCDSYENHDQHDNGGLANGFSMVVSSGKHVFYKGCRAWLNSDDGFDMFTNTAGGGYITFENCWAFENGSFGGAKGNGAGFKTGLCVDPPIGGVQRILNRCLSFHNIIGFDESQDSGAGIPHTIYNCTSFNNSHGFNFGYGGNSIDIIRNNISYNEKIGGLGSNTVDHNSWQNGLSVSDADFISLDSDQAKEARQADGSLPDMTFLHLTALSDLIDAGIEVGLPFNGKAPDLGAFEFESGLDAPLPVLISSVVENATPSLLEMTYDLSLNNLVIPATSSFNVMVNTHIRSVILVSISGHKVQLTLESAVSFDDNIIVSYTKPSVNPLKSVSGTKAESIYNNSVTNNCKDPDKPIVLEK